MKYRIHFEAIWRRSAGNVHAGDYRVPEDLSEAVAQEAMKEGVAVKLTKKSAPESK